MKILNVTPIVEPMPEGAAKKYAGRIGSLRRKDPKDPNKLLNTCAPRRK